MKRYYHVDDLLKDHRPEQGKVLIVGSKVYDGKEDRRSLYQNAIGLDMQKGKGVDIVHDFEQPLPIEHGKFDHIDCCSVLEHVKRPWLMAFNIESIMNEGATILLSVPFSWRVHDYPGDYWRMTTSAFPILFPSVKWETTRFLLDNGSRKLVPGIKKHGITYYQKAEAIGFGVKCTT